MDDDEIAMAIAAFQNAAFENDSWPEALSWLHRASGGWATQLIGITPSQDLRLHFTSNITDDMTDALSRYPWHDPLYNLRARLAFAPSSFRVYQDDDLSTRAERDRNAIYNELFIDLDAPNIAAAKFDAFDDLLVAAFTIRTAKQGDASEKEKQAMSALLPHVKSAIRTQEAMEGKAVDILTGTFENLSVAAILCAADGRIVSATPAAEKELALRHYVHSINGQLAAIDPDVDARLGAAIHAAGRRYPAGVATTVILTCPERQPRIAEVAPLPRSNYALGFGAVAVVALPRPRRRDVQSLLRRGFGLSDAEADIAERLIEGQRTNDIADNRRATIGTVRTQMKAVLTKLGASSQNEALVRLFRFLGRPL